MSVPLEYPYTHRNIMPKFIFGFENFLICVENWRRVMETSVHPYTFWNKLNLGWGDIYGPL
jgi:hypothetical protein